MERTYTNTKKAPDFINKQMDKGSLKKIVRSDVFGIRRC